MADYAWPTANFKIAQQALVLVPNTRTFQSPYTGAQQTVDLLGERWKWNLSIIGATRAVGMQRQAFLNALRGASKTVALSDLMNPTATGSWNGQVTITNGITAQGATSIQMWCIPGSVANVGDKFGIGAMLFEVAAPATASGGSLITVSITSRVRVAIGAGAAVVMSSPAVNAVLTGVGAPVLFGIDEAQPMQLEFVETF